MRIIFLGTPDFAVASLNALIQHKFDVKLYNINFLTFKKKMQLINKLLFNNYSLKVKSTDDLYFLTDLNIWYDIPRINKIIVKKL